MDGRLALFQVSGDDKAQFAFDLKYCIQGLLQKKISHNVNYNINHSKRTVGTYKWNWKHK